MLALLAGALALACSCTGGGPEPFPHEAGDRLAFAEADAASVTTYLSLRAGLSLPPGEVESLASSRVSLVGRLPPEAARTVLDTVLACHRWHVESRPDGDHLVPLDVATFRTHDSCVAVAVPAVADGAALVAAARGALSPRGAVALHAPSGTFVLADLPDPARAALARARALDPSVPDVGAP
jgi:hypothetical protein